MTTKVGKLGSQCRQGDQTIEEIRRKCDEVVLQQSPVEESTNIECGGEKSQGFETEAVHFQQYHN